MLPHSEETMLSKIQISLKNIVFSTKNGPNIGKFHFLISGMKLTGGGKTKTKNNNWEEGGKRTV